MGRCLNLDRQQEVGPDIHEVQDVPDADEGGSAHPFAISELPVKRIDVVGPTQTGRFHRDADQRLLARHHVRDMLRCAFDLQGRSGHIIGGIAADNLHHVVAELADLLPQVVVDGDDPLLGILILGLSDLVSREAFSVRVSVEKVVLQALCHSGLLEGVSPQRGAGCYDH